MSRAPHTIRTRYDRFMARATTNPSNALSVRPRRTRRTRVPRVSQGEAGTSTGINIAPGSNDDGWIVPQPVRLSDGTRIQLYKDGEALHAAYEAIKHAKKRVC